jgi:serine/threonine protein kinase
MPALAASIRRLTARPPAERRLGPFLLLEQLGHGGFAPVWLAREVYGHTELRSVALKLFALDGDGASPGKRRQIIEEARALCQVEHPSVVRFYSLPIDEAAGIVGLAMEHVAGRSLDRRLAAEGRLGVDEALALGIAIASALSAVHRAGVVHRDVKPANVVDAGGVYKLIDFGISAADPLTGPAEVDAAPAPAEGPSGADAVPATTPLDDSRREPEAGASTARARLPCGTVGYIDPVCTASGAEPNAASDLYALGAMLFECLTGLVPAVARSGEERWLRADVLEGRSPAPPLHEAAPDAPVGLARVVDALLAPERRARPATAEAVARALEDVRAERAGRARVLPEESVGPFRGLGRFEEGDRGVYFGRTSEIAAGVEMLRQHGFVVLLGPSGSGKSSLARAGVLPAVVDGALGARPARWQSAVLAPGRDPRAALVAALAPFVPGAAELGPEALLGALAERAAARDTGTILLVDQLEELATIAAPEGRAFALAFLAGAAELGLPGVRVLAAARRDLLDPLLALGDLGRAITRGLVLVEPLRDVAWAGIVAQAMGAFGYAFEDESVEADVLSELRGTEGAMPLVQFALTELWRRRDVGRRRITRAALTELGGIAGALERHADATLAQIEARRAGGLETARRILLALTTPQGTRRARAAADLRGLADAHAADALGALEQARLVVRADDGVTLAHEALLTQWGRLRAWVAEAREARLLAAEVERDAALWEADRDAVRLFRGRRLAHALELTGGELGGSPRALAFLRESRAAERRGRAFTAIAAVTLLLGVSGGVTAYVRAIRAEEAKTRVALASERRSREDADRTTREVVEAQAQIKALLQQLDASPPKDRILALQEKILDAPLARGLAPRPSPTPRAGASAVAPLAPEPPRPREVASAAPSAVPTTIKEQVRWE